MRTSTSDQAEYMLEVVKEEEISAPVDVVFEALLEQFGPGFDTPEGSTLPMKLEPWPGGRWYRDLGDNAGHLWGHVQVIKPPALLEISGPLFMSYPVISHVQCRVTANGGVTRLKITHRAMGQITPDHREGMSRGWSHIITRIREAAERRTGAPRRQAQR
jgi:uncharacterized protein YndB with AHSA1/START domain